MANPLKIQTKVALIEAFGTGVYKVELKPLGRVPRFKPGQFLHLTVDEYDPTGGFWPESRVFSVSSGYGDEYLVFVYSVKGHYTKRMERELEVGKNIWVKLPYGDFVIDTASATDHDLVLIAGGTGVSPYIPFLSGINRGDSSLSGKIALYYGARQRSYILFKDILGRCAGMDGLSLSLSIEEESPEGLGVPGARIEKGRLDIAKIRSETENLKDPVYYLSGPPGMIRTFKQELLDTSVAYDHIIIDEWE